jgi:hypothetical protein
MKLDHCAFSDGKWLCKLVDGGPDNKDTEIIWSKLFRNLLGYGKFRYSQNLWTS